LETSGKYRKTGKYRVGINKKQLMLTITTTIKTSVSVIKNKAGDSPRPTRENGPDPIFYIYILKFTVKIALSDSGFSLGLVQKCLLSTSWILLLLVFNQIFLSDKKYR